MRRRGKRRAAQMPDENVHFKRLLAAKAVDPVRGASKRGMICVYQHCGEQHLHRYLAEFDFQCVNYFANSGYRSV